MILSDFIAYFSIVLLATIIPGPSMLLALNHGVNYGWVKAIHSGAGNMLGNFLMALSSLMGLSVLLIASGVIFNIIKWLGIGYLIFIGIKLILEPARDITANPRKLATEKTKWRLFIDGFFIAIGNPKGILFFTALFPQFIKVNNTSMHGYIIAFTTLAVIAFACFMLYASIGERINRLFHTGSFSKIYNRITGSLFIGVALSIAFSRK